MELETEWVKRPVIYLSMSLGGSSAQTLTEYLNNVLSSYEKIYGRNPDEQSLGNRLNGIIQRAYEQAGVQIALLLMSMMLLCCILMRPIIMMHAVRYTAISLLD